MRALSFLSLFVLSSTTALAAPKNVIYMIGDGMGPAYLTAYRYYQHSNEHGTNASRQAVANTIFDDLLTGMASTYPDDDTLVTDSAAGATALATGVKSFNGAISVNRQHIPIGTMMQLAKQMGKANGIVASSQVNHATPAAFVSHNVSRRNLNAIADMYFDYRINGKPVADVILGGGTDYFVREDRNLITEFKSEGYQYADSWQQLDILTRKPAIALLDNVGLPAALNTKQPRQLATLTEKALQLLSPAEKGFVLMVEGSQIDWCGHDNDIACAMAEMHDFAQAIAVAKAYVDANPDTLLVITADHETGGMSLGADGKYLWLPDVIQNVTATGRKIADELNAASSDEAALSRWLELTKIKLTTEQQQQLLAQRGKEQKDLREVAVALIAKYSYTGWTTGGHTAADVPLMAYGKNSADFHGFMDNTAIAKQLLRYISTSPQ
ncbi:alkaline phosphatase [Alishewanella longhuensis]|uniref:Alkaline phosphatase n=1 Tax=Alishewanella longhuensis TaxID=1091037 RepID=A0ABQ3KVU6_9ALTE|nr:alkaline phosphatase [Alishewanella longhuensis]GHG63663.1 alkaline phosphatase [Alishewanella longhuensis]